MISPPDAFEALRRANPVPDEAAVATLVDDPEVFLGLILNGGAAAPVGRQRSRRRLGAAVGVSALAIGGLAGGRYVLQRPVTKPVSVACYAAPSLDARSVVEPAQGDPVEQCRQAWRTGAFGSPSEPPPLLDCVLPSGVRGVFPGSSDAACDSIGASRPAPVGGPPPGVPDGQPGIGAEADVAALRDALTLAVSGARCQTRDEAAHTVRQELAARGLAAWRVEDAPGDGAGFDAVRRCASVAIDAERRLVLLVPVPEPPAPRPAPGG